MARIGLYMENSRALELPGKQLVGHEYLMREQEVAIGIKKLFVFFLKLTSRNNSETKIIHQRPFTFRTSIQIPDANNSCMYLCIMHVLGCKGTYYNLKQDWEAMNANVKPYILGVWCHGNPKISLDAQISQVIAT